MRVARRRVYLGHMDLEALGEPVVPVGALEGLKGLQGKRCLARLQ